MYTIENEELVLCQESVYQFISTLVHNTDTTRFLLRVNRSPALFECTRNSHLHAVRFDFHTVKTYVSEDGQWFELKDDEFFKEILLGCLSVSILCPETSKKSNDKIDMKLRYLESKFN